MNITPEIKRFVADKIRITASEHLSRQELSSLTCNGRLKISVAEDLAGSLVCHLETYIHGMEDQKIYIHRQWPKDWWQAFKERWFAAWMKRRWPVEYKQIDIEERIFKSVCPHLVTDHAQKHLEFLTAS